MAKQPSAKSLANLYGNLITLENYDKAIEAAQANGQNRTPAAPRDEFFTGGVTELAIESLPEEAMNRELLKRMMTGNEIKVLGARGGEGLTRMPRSGRIAMLSADHPHAGGQNGVIAVYTTNDDGQTCARPVVCSSAEWQRQFTDQPTWGVTHLAAPFPWDAGRYYPRNGQKVGNGFTFVVDLRLTDVSGAQHALGLHRFFVRARDYFGLVAPTQPGSVASKVLQQGLDGKLPSNTDELAIVAARAVLADNDRISYRALALAYLNIGQAMSEAESEQERLVRANILGSTPIAEATLHLRAIRAENARLEKEREARRNGSFGSSAAVAAIDNGEPVDEAELAEIPSL